MQVRSSVEDDRSAVLGHGFAVSIHALVTTIYRDSDTELSGKVALPGLRYDANT
jgi:hypothetical protein